MKLAVLDLSHYPPDLMAGKPKFGQVLRDWLARGLPDAALQVIDIYEGEPMPEIGAFDGFVLSGAAEGVYDDTPWMAPLRDLIRAVRDARKPMLGICFGHQIMADTLGGRAEKVGPPVVGVRRFVVDGVRVPAHVWHQDQVTEKPPGAQVIAQSDYCPFAGLEYDFPALSVQFHPEYSADYMGTFLRNSRGAYLTEEQTDAVLAELASGAVAADLFADRAGDFFRKALTPA